MKIINRYQQGGPMPAPEGGEPMPPEAGGAPAPEGVPAPGGEAGGDPIMAIAQGAAQALQTQDCNIAMQVCQMFLSLVQGAAQGGAPEAGGGPAAGEPVFKKGGKLCKRIPKKKCKK